MLKLRFFENFKTIANIQKKNVNNNMNLLKIQEIF